MFSDSLPSILDLFSPCKEREVPETEMSGEQRKVVVAFFLQCTFFLFLRAKRHAPPAAFILSFSSSSQTHPCVCESVRLCRGRPEGRYL